MLVTKRAVYDIATWNLLEWEGYSYSGPVEECKGADVANDQRRQELDMQKQAFAAQQKQLDFLNTNLSKYLTSNVGFDPQQLAAIRSNALDTNATQFNQAGQAVRQALLARGSGDGTAPASGDLGRGLSSLLGAAASSKASTLQGIDIANAQQALANRFNSASVLSGNAATLNGAQSVAGSGASNALGDYIKAANSGFGASFLNGLGGTLGGSIGSGFGAGLTGGIGNVFSKVPGFGG